MQRFKADLCERCHEPRGDHMPGAHYGYGKSGFSSGGLRDVAVLAVTCGTLSSCVAFIEPGERVPLLNELLPERSLEFFNLRWAELHGQNTALRRPHFARDAVAHIERSFIPANHTERAIAQLWDRELKKEEMHGQE